RQAKVAETERFPFLTGSEYGLDPLASCTSWSDDRGMTHFSLLIPPGSLESFRLYAFQVLIRNPSETPSQNSWKFELWSKISSGGLPASQLIQSREVAGYDLLVTQPSVLNFQYARAEKVVHAHHDEYTVAVEFKPRNNCGGSDWAAFALFGSSICVIKVELPAEKCLPNWVFDRPHLGTGFDRCTNDTLFPSLRELRCLPTGTVMTPKRNQTRCWFELLAGTIQDTFDYVFQIEIVSSEHLSESDENIWSFRTFEHGLNLINFHPDATGFTIGTTTTTTTTRAFTYAAVYAADSRSVCVAFDVDNALPDPTLDIYLPEGFRSGGCPFEANATLFPECLGELPAPSLDAISCKEMWDGRMLSYYLHISVAGMANASGFAGYALQLDLRAPRIMPRANIWKLDMRSSDHKAYVAAVEGFVLGEWSDTCFSA
ncbi:unnamed protein product, partial [Effrenium voratum]